MANSIHKVVRKLKRAVLRDEPTYYDMFLNDGERFFARLYLHQIRQWLGTQGLAAPLKILDAGCQSGRLSIPLALEGHQVTGVDTSAVGLNRARRHAREAGTSLQLIRADLGRWLPGTPNHSFDILLCTEVLYLRPNHKELLKNLIRVLRPGGLCFISHRPTGYYLAEAFQHRDRDAVRTLLSAKEGTLFGSYYNWQDREDLLLLYPQAGVEILSIAPIGFLSWLAVNPETFQPDERELLFQAELASEHRCDGSGRYLLVIGKKK